MTSKNKTALLGMFLVVVTCNAYADVASMIGAVTYSGRSVKNSILTNRANIAWAVGAVACGVYAFRNGRHAYDVAKEVVVPKDVLKRIENGHQLTEEETILYLVYLQQINELENLKSKMLQGAFGFATCGGFALTKAVLSGAWGYVPAMSSFSAKAVAS